MRGNSRRRLAALRSRYSEELGGKTRDRGMFTNSFLMVTGDQVSKKTGKRPVCPLPFVPFS